MVVWPHRLSYIPGFIYEFLYEYIYQNETSNERELNLIILMEYLRYHITGGY